MTRAEALEGFPLSQREYAALEALVDDGGRLPKGVGPQTRQNLLGRDWLRQIGVDEQYHPIFVTTSEGLIAIQIDNIAINNGKKRPSPLTSMARQGAYLNLSSRLKFLSEP